MKFFSEIIQKQGLSLLSASSHLTGGDLLSFCHIWEGDMFVYPSG